MSEVELEMALRADVKAAFPMLVETYQDALYRFGLRLTGNSHDAEEVAQDAFVRAFRWLLANSPPGEGQLKAWLYQVTLNVFRNRVRKPKLPTAALDAAELVRGDDGLEPATAAAAAETRAELAQVLSRLPLRYREAVVLRHVEDLTYPEMAAVLARPEGTVKSDVHRGLGLLRAALAETREEVLV
ncbi:MAG TPA: RNA polymerase sigma factor [Chloroflexota bacterium]|nr:RNA polymerase sigma factor [Chloroflexota bacterium]